MILYSYFRSSTSYRVRIALNLLGYDYETRPVNLLEGENRSAAFLKVNPFGTLPALDWKGRIYTQSLAIMTALEEGTAQGSLWPSELAALQLARECAYAIATETHAPNNLARLKDLKSMFGADQEAIKTWYAAVIRHTFAPLEQKLAALKLAAGALPFGAPGAFEACLVPQIYNARRFEAPLDDYPTLNAINKVCAALPAFDNAAPENQPDAA